MKPQSTLIQLRFKYKRYIIIGCDLAVCKKYCSGSKMRFDTIINGQWFGLVKYRAFTEQLLAYLSSSPWPIHHQYYIDDRSNNVRSSYWRATLVKKHKRVGYHYWPSKIDAYRPIYSVHSNFWSDTSLHFGWSRTETYIHVYLYLCLEQAICIGYLHKPSSVNQSANVIGNMLRAFNTLTPPPTSVFGIVKTYTTFPTSVLEIQTDPVTAPTKS